MEGELLGREHRKIVDGLVDRLHRIQVDEPVARIVLLEGASGVGKSRIVREVYERLRADQPTNSDGEGYWPALVGAGEDQAPVPGREQMPVRKILGPKVNGFVRPSETLPAFFWWPVACDQLTDGSMIDVVGSLDTQLRAHFRFWVEAFRRQASSGQQFRKWLRREAPKEAAEIAREGGLEAVSAALDSAGIALPGAGYALARAVRLGDSIRKRRATTRDVSRGGALDSTTSGARILYEQVTRILHPRLPLVLVIEDLHLMGPGLADLLDYMAQPLDNKPVLVIGTVWPEAVHREPYAGWLANEQAWRKEHASSPVVRIAVPNMHRDDLIDLAARYAPQSDRQVLGLVADRWANPYSLKLAMTDPRLVRARIKDGALQTTPRDLARLPHTIRGLYERRWAELPESIRAALMLAAGCLPAGPETGDWQLRPFMHSVVLEASHRVGLVDDPDAVADGLGAAADPYGWTRGRDSAVDLDQFREWVLAKIARAASDDVYGDAELHAATATLLRERFAEKIAATCGYYLDLDDPLVEPAAQWLLALLGDSRPTMEDGVAALVLARLRARAYGFREAVAVMAPDRVAAMAPDAPDTLRARSDIAFWTGEAGDAAGALRLFEELLEDQVRVLGPDAPDTLRARSDIAFWTGEVGDAAGALRLFEELLPDRVRVLGPDAPYTLRTRRNIAFWTGEAGDAAGALRLFEELLEDQVRVLGQDAPEALRTRGAIDVLRECTTACGAEER